jgi:CDP-glycerol glycerophosphotransferase (TagB/SpsB family)
MAPDLIDRETQQQLGEVRQLRQPSSPPLTGRQPDAAPRRARPVQYTARQRRRSFALAALNWLAPKDPRRVVLHSVPNLDDTTLALLAELRHRDKKVVILLDDGVTDVQIQPEHRSFVRLVPKQSARAMWHFVRSKSVITTHGLYGGLRPPPGQTVVNVWHGELTKQIARYDEQKPVVASLAPVTSGIGRAFRCAEFGMHPRQVIVTGAPRNDRLLRCDPAEVRARLQIPADCARVHIWLPTYRRSVRGQIRVDSIDYPAGLPISTSDAVQLDAWLRQRNDIVIGKLHPLADRSELPPLQHLRILTDRELRTAGVTLYELLGASNALITDISSVWIDYLLLDRPIVGVFPDRAEFSAGRGLLLEPYDEWFPGPLVTTVSGLMHELANLEHDPDQEKRRSLAHKLHAHRDARSSARLLDAMQL